MGDSMELWYTENHTDHVKFSMKVKEQLLSRQSDFQHIAILDTVEFGTGLNIGRISDGNGKR